jgi:hypothetical protein
MSISSDYPRPISVNGFVCRNCDDVSDAKKFIDPAAPKGGELPPAASELSGSAVLFGGALADRRVSAAVDVQPVSDRLDRYA